MGSGERGTGCNRGQPGRGAAAPAEQTISCRAAQQPHTAAAKQQTRRSPRASLGGSVVAALQLGLLHGRGGAAGDRHLLSDRAEHAWGRETRPLQDCGMPPASRRSRSKCSGWGQGLQRHLAPGTGHSACDCLRVAAPPARACSGHTRAARSRRRRRQSRSRTGPPAAWSCRCQCTAGAGAGPSRAGGMGQGAHTGKSAAVLLAAAVRGSATHDHALLPQHVLLLTLRVLASARAEAKHAGLTPPSPAQPAGAHPPPPQCSP